MRPLYVRIARQLLRLHENQRLPRRNNADFIEWDPREFNGLADEAANKALDMGQDWFVQHAGNMQRASEASDVNYRFSFDGAKRPLAKQQPGQ